MSERTWTQMLLGQLTFHWDHQLRQRLEGLTDHELIHHGAEVALLRDLYEHEETTDD